MCFYTKNFDVNIGQIFPNSNVENRILVNFQKQYHLMIYSFYQVRSLATLLQTVEVDSKPPRTIVNTVSCLYYSQVMSRWARLHYLQVRRDTTAVVVCCSSAARQATYLHVVCISNQLSARHKTLYALDYNTFSSPRDLHTLWRDSQFQTINILLLDSSAGYSLLF